MRSHLQQLFDLLPQYWAVRDVLIIPLAVTSPFLILWLISTQMARLAVTAANKSTPGLSRPPTMPYAIPFLGHIIQFIWDPKNCVSKAASYISYSVPVRIILPIFSPYVISGPESILQFFKESAQKLSAMPRGNKVIKNVFGCPSHLIYLFGSRLDENIEHHPQSNAYSGVSTTQLDTLVESYQMCLIEQIEQNTDNIGDNWVEFPDLNAFVDKHVLEASVRPLFGAYMLSLNPTLAEDFWNFDKFVGKLFMGVPQWINPAAYKARDNMVENIKRWHRHAREHCNIDKLGDTNWDPYYGSKFIIERLHLLTEQGILEEDARVAAMFAFFWVTNSNSIPAITWFLFETLQDPSLKTEVSARLPATARVASSDKKKSLPLFDIAKLCSDPLLQSMYAETLRLRVAAIIIRQATQENYSFCGWDIKKSEALSICTLTEQMNPGIWSTGSSHNQHPLDTFWAKRFIVDPSDPSSGPLKTQKQRRGADREKPYFSLDGLSGSWIPFGGGWGICPGRHFAKREILATTAIFLTAYEIELVSETNKKKLRVDIHKFGFGTMPPDRKVAFRIRRRRKDISLG